MPQPLPSSAQVTAMTGWRQVFLPGHQVARRFRDERGMYRYGYFDAGGEDVFTAEAGSDIRFAVIDASASSWQEALRSAFRHDCDFYVIDRIGVGMAAVVDGLIRPGGIPAVLCIGVAAAD